MSTPIGHPALENEDAAQALVDEWTAKLGAISRNLMDMQASNAVKNAEMREKFNEPYTGATAPIARAALNELHGLWKAFELLARAQDEAQAICNRRGLFRASKIEAAKKLLLPSVAMPSVYVPVGQRDLLGDAERTQLACPAEVLEEMQRSFNRARDSFDAIERAENELAQSAEQAKKEAGSLAQWAKALGAEKIDGVNLEALARDISDDPIGASAKLSVARVAIEKERHRLQAIQQAGRELDAGFEEARRSLASLRELGDRARLAIEETKLKILPPWTFLAPDAPQAATALEDWLETLAKNRAAGRVEAAQVGFKNWRANCAASAQQAQKVYTQNRAMLDERSELKGRFSALDAKAAALIARGANPAGWQAIQRQAQEVLWTKPMDMPSARKLVAAFEGSLYAANRG